MLETRIYKVVLRPFRSMEHILLSPNILHIHNIIPLSDLLHTIFDHIIITFTRL